MIISPEQHLRAIAELAETTDLSLYEAVLEYQRRHNLDTYYIADIIRSDRQFMQNLTTSTRTLKLLKP